MFAPLAGQFYDAAHRNDLSVLLIDDASLEKSGLTWPVPYSYEARLLKAVGRYRPKAVFLDIYFKESRNAPGLAQLTDEICALKAQGIPVFLGATKNAEDQFSLRPELEAIAGKCFKKVALYYAPDEIDKTAWSYPVSTDADPQRGGVAVKSAAVAMYDEFAAASLVPKTSRSNLALTWGSKMASHGIAWTAQNEGESRPDAYCRADQGWSELIPEGLRPVGIEHAEKPICVYHDTLLAQDLAANSSVEEQTVDRQIRGKIVLIGTALAGSRDEILSPLHGRIPGVYLHAMALDNLLTYGTDYPEDITLELKNDRSHWKLFLFLIFSLLLGALSKHFYHRLLKHEKLVALYDGLKKRHAGARWAWPRSACKFFISNSLESELKLVRATSMTARCLLLICYEALTAFSKLAVIAFATCIFLLLGIAVFHIGFISIFSVVLFTVAAEWLEVKDKMVEHFFSTQNPKSLNISPS